MEELLIFIRHSTIGTIAGLICILFLMSIAHRIDLVDHPGGRKKHVSSTPLIGGIAIYFGMSVTLLIHSDILQYVRDFWLATGILLCIGILDDLRDINAKLRLITQIFACLILILSGQVYLDHLGNLFFTSDIYLGSLSGVVTLFITVMFINALNMLDGLDGLASGVAAGQCVLLLGISLYLQDRLVAQLLVSFLLLLILFLVFNAPLPRRKHAHIFLGDSGSTILAFIIAWAAVHLIQNAPSETINPITVLWCIVLPFMEIVCVCYIRLRSKKSFMKPGHDHIHYILIQNGLSKPLTVVFIVLLSLGFGLIGFVMSWLEISESWQFISILCFLCVYIRIVSRGYDAEAEMTLLSRPQS